MIDPSYLFSLYPLGDFWGLVFSELLTAQIFVTTIAAGSEKLLEAELIRFFPDEIIISQGAATQTIQSFFKRLGYFVTVINESAVLDNKDNAIEWTKKQFSSSTCGFIENDKAIQQALFYFYAYMSKNQRASLDLFTSILFYKSDDFLILDSATQRNLELIKNITDGGVKNTLFGLMDTARTAMGSRMIKKWLLRPLVKRDAIIQRQDVVALCCSDISFSQIIEQVLSKIGDFERVVGRIALQRASLSDYVSLSRTLVLIPVLQNSLLSYRMTCLINIIKEQLGNFQQLSDLLIRALHDEPSSELIIKSGYDDKLDQMRVMVNNSNEQIIDLELCEQKATGISSLKIRYNAIQGYYIEITNSNLSAVPTRYRRLQTLVGRERFITPELQQLQVDIESARKDIVTHENALFAAIKSEVAEYISVLRKSAYAIADLDALLAFGRNAYENGYVRPEFNDMQIIIIDKGRHPVVENAIGSTFIPNDTVLNKDQSLWIITGPNMGGKSTYLRQVALISIMAHVGSFVPAARADIALLDRIFTRLGASDNVSEGKSTFLVEMEETATICTQATEKSLVILDEVGRGTSTFDGLAIAQAVVEYIKSIGAKCLFATHYHELTYLKETHHGIVTYYAASKKTDAGILFLYKMVEGVADGSFGIEVAKLAHLPSEVITRSVELVDLFVRETIHSTLAGGAGRETDYDALYQANMSLKAENKRLLDECFLMKNKISLLQNIDFDALSPKKAFDLLWEYREN